MKRFIPLSLLLIGTALIYISGLHKYLSFQTIKTHHLALKALLDAHPLLFPLLYMILYALMTAFSIPGAIFFTLLGGYLFPIPLSTLYVVLSASTGATLLFLAARSAIGDSLRKRAGPFLKKMEKGFQKNATSYLLFLRFIPLFPFWIVNLAPAFFHVPVRTFIWTTLVGITPGSFAFTLAGQGLEKILATEKDLSINTIFNLQLKIALILLGVLALLPIAIKKVKKYI